MVGRRARKDITMKAFHMAKENVRKLVLASGQKEQDGLKEQKYRKMIGRIRKVRAIGQIGEILP